MPATRGYAVQTPTSRFAPFDFERREPGPHDVQIDILYCGICHSDIHQARGEWGNSTYPMVPGHEIVGRVTRIGSDVKKFKTGDMAGVGCFIDSCRTCGSCQEGEDSYCEGHMALTYNGTEMDGKTPTYGGYSSSIVVDENYTLRIPPNLTPANAAPLLCAGITTYSPLRHFKVGPGSRVAVAGLGGLGHMGVKIAAAMGATVTVLSTSASKEQDARKLGAHEFAVTKDPATMERLANHFDVILDTISADHDVASYMNLLRRDGVMVLVGVPTKPAEVHAFTFIMKRRSLAGSLIGGIRETQEMLDFCAQHDITSDIEVINIQDLDTAYERTIKGDVRYRFVIDMQSLK
ncbi:MAG: NAD(P)-dependent alcohol dehydrogenase [Gemmatimonadales bacterium]|nr:NAD(P)-dependent alcohol dehydrogenase [Gemmatimonadales bacterium]